MCVKACTYISIWVQYTYFFVSWTWTGQSFISIAKSFSIIAMALFPKNPSTLGPNECWNTTHEMNGSMIRLQENHHLRVRFERTNNLVEQKKHLKNSSQKQIICSGGDFIKNSLKPPTSQDVSHFLAMVPVKMIPPVRWCGSPDGRIIEPVVSPCLVDMSCQGGPRTWWS